MIIDTIPRNMRSASEPKKQYLNQRARTSTRQRRVEVTLPKLSITDIGNHADDGRRSRSGNRRS